MIVEDERINYAHHGYDIPQFDEEESGENRPFNSSEWTYSTNRPVDMSNFIANKIRLRDRETHHQLKADLKENIWQKFRST